MSAGDTGEREIIIEKATADQAQTKINRGRRNGERKIWLYGTKTTHERGKGASEMPGAPIKVDT
jgi:hypothetical protein